MSENYSSTLHVTVRVYGRDYCLHFVIKYSVHTCTVHTLLYSTCKVYRTVLKINKKQSKLLLNKELLILVEETSIKNEFANFQILTLFD